MVSGEEDGLIERENPGWVDLSEEWGMPVKMFGER
jgi:hypothetical protein